MKQDKWIDKIKEKLHNHPTAVPQSLWEKIDRRLPAPIIVFKHRFIGIAAAVAAMIVIVSISLFITDRHISYDDNIITYNNTNPISTIVEDKKDIEQRDNIEHISNIVKPSYTAQNNSTNTPIAYHDNTSAPHESTTQTIFEEETAILYNDEKSSKEKSKYKEIPQVDTNVPLITYCNKKDSCNEQDSENITKHITPKRESTHWLAFEANTSSSERSITPFSYRCEEAEVTFDHHMPLNVKVLFEKRFNKWSIGTGISYTYLTADYQISNKLRSGKQEMHYVGIPLYAGYEFARINRFSFYTTLGGQIDFNTASSFRETSKRNADVEKKNFRDEKPQLSAQIQVGASFEILPHFDLYLAPTIGYYFDNGSKYHSVWQDCPLNISLSIGLRTKF